LRVPSSRHDSRLRHHPNPSQQARNRTRGGFPSELRPPGSAAIDLNGGMTQGLDGAGHLWRAHTGAMFTDFADER
jgi:hypothetical protein